MVLYEEFLPLADSSFDVALRQSAQLVLVRFVPCLARFDCRGRGDSEFKCVMLSALQVFDTWVARTKTKPSTPRAVLIHMVASLSLVCKMDSEDWATILQDCFLRVLETHFSAEQIDLEELCKAERAIFPQVIEAVRAPCVGSWVLKFLANFGDLLPLEVEQSCLNWSFVVIGCHPPRAAAFGICAFVLMAVGAVPYAALRPSRVSAPLWERVVAEITVRDPCLSGWTAAQDLSDVFEEASGMPLSNLVEWVLPVVEILRSSVAPHVPALI